MTSSDCNDINVILCDCSFKYSYFSLLDVVDDATPVPDVDGICTLSSIGVNDEDGMGCLVDSVVEGKVTAAWHEAVALGSVDDVEGVAGFSSVHVGGMDGPSVSGGTNEGVALGSADVEAVVGCLSEHDGMDGPCTLDPGGTGGSGGVHDAAKTK